MPQTLLHPSSSCKLKSDDASLARFIQQEDYKLLLSKNTELTLRRKL